MCALQRFRHAKYMTLCYYDYKATCILLLAPRHSSNLSTNPLSVQVLDLDIIYLHVLSKCLELSFVYFLTLFCSLTFFLTLAIIKNKVIAREDYYYYSFILVIYLTIKYF